MAISAAIFTALSSDNSPVNWVAGLITFTGRQDNLTLREAALFAFCANLLMVAVAVISIVLTVPKGKLREEPEQSAAKSPAPAVGQNAGVARA